MINRRTRRINKETDIVSKAEFNHTKEILNVAKKLGAKITSSHDNRYGREHYKAFKIRMKGKDGYKIQSAS